jgi:methylmalonyl-CoA mutase
MLDFADIVVVNKFEKRGGEDAVRDVRKQVQRNRNAFDRPPEDMPVFGTIASKFNDDGVTALYIALLDGIQEKTGWPSNPPAAARGTKLHLQDHHHPAGAHPLPGGNCRNGRETTIRETDGKADAMRRVWHLEETARRPEESGRATDRQVLVGAAQGRGRARPARPLPRRLFNWSRVGETRRYSGDELVYRSGEKRSACPFTMNRSPTRRSPRSLFPDLTIPVRFTAGCGGKTCPATSPSPPVCFP